jgi:hypothetical protein
LNENEFKENEIKEEERYELPAPEHRSMLWSVLSLVIGIFSVVACAVYPLGIALSLVGFGFSVYSWRRCNFFTRINLSGLIISIVGFVFGVFSMIASLLGIFG